MERPIQAMTVGVEALLTLAGVLTVLFLLGVSDYRSVTGVLALVLLVGIPTAALGDDCWRNYRELRSGD